MAEDFTDRVQQLGTKGMKIMDEYFDGKEKSADMIKYASKAVSQTITALNMKRVGKYQDRSLSLRLLKFLPTDENFRAKYIKVTNPELKPILIGLPK